MTAAETIVEGVSLESYAFMTAGLADGLALDDLLEHQRLDPSAWDRADEAWGEVLLEDLEHEMELTFALDEAQRKAREVWVRPIPPLDSDLRAWLDFLRGLGGLEDVMAHLAAIPLSASDLGRLQRQWAAKMTEDPALMETASAILATPAEPVEVPSPGPPWLPPRTDEGTGTGFYGSLADEELPFDAPPKDELRLAPPLSVPLPPPPADGDVDGTAALGMVIGDLTLPFGKVTTPEAEVATPAEPHVSPPPPPASPPALVPPSPTIGHAPSPIDGTAIGAVAPIGDALPFDPDAPAAHPPAPTPDAAVEIGGDTSFLDVAQLGLDALPFDDEDDLDGTALAMAPISEAPLPFRPGTSPSPAPSPNDVNAPHPEAGGTSYGIRAEDLMASATPFELGTTLIPGGLTLEQYAAVEEELAIDPSRAPSVLHQYGLDAERRRQHAEAVRVLFARDATAKSRWEKARLTYRAWRRGGGS